MDVARLRPPMQPAAASTDEQHDPPIVLLDDPRALDPGLTGAKAAALAAAAHHGLPVLPGFVVTTAAIDGGTVVDRAVEQLRAARDDLATPDDRALVVRSSSTVEDGRTSSMAGQFTSVLGVRGWPSFLDAVSAVLASAAHPRDEVTAARPMAALVQPQLDPVCGGVLFGLDPVTGNRRHLIVEAVPGTPDVLVSGTVTAAHFVLGRRGRFVGGGAPHHRVLLNRSRRRRLARLARRAAAVFDGPQDLEWAFDRDDRLWLLQSRAVTATGRAAEARGPILGPGPVAETFPEPLRPLEAALWIEPLRRGVVGSLQATGAVSQRRIDTSPVVTTVGGWAAADLELFGIVPSAGGVRRALSPLRGLRRLVAAWQVGRLRAALPALSADLIAAVDADLVAVGDPTACSDTELLDILCQAEAELTALHGHEVLAGMLLGGGGDRSSAGALALEALARGRAEGWTDDRLVARSPVTLALLPPTIGPRSPLPAAMPVGLPMTAGSIAELGSREALRLRCRWVQELTAQVARELGRRLVVAGVLERADQVRELGLDELRAAVLGQRVPADLDARASVAPGPSLPMAFRLASPSVPIAVAPPDRVDGLPASAGRTTGVVCHDANELPAGPCVLVVDTLDPRLAPALPQVAGLVSETGSALSHLAILAREMHVPAVVAVPDARRRFPVGTRVLVDGGIGEVRAVAEGDHR